MILGYKSPQKLSERANMCPGRQKKPHPAHGKTPPVRKHTSAWDTPRASTHRRLGSRWRGQSTPQLFKGPGPEKRGLCAWGHTHPGEETHGPLMFLHVGQEKPVAGPPPCLPGGTSCRWEGWGGGPPKLSPIPG